MKFLENAGVPIKDIIDGKIFRVQGFDFLRFLDEGIVYGTLTKERGSLIFPPTLKSICPIVYNDGKIFTMKIGRNSEINPKGHTVIEALPGSKIDIGNFTAMSWNITFELGLNGRNHNYKNVSLAWGKFDWNIPEEFVKYAGACKINIGSDVLIGRNCILKCANPDKPLIIGDGAVVASNSVVVKSVPPYAIVGGNPAKIIKYRFPEKIIEALLRIKWWDWDLDKIHDNFKYFNNVEKFVELHDKGV